MKQLTKSEILSNIKSFDKISKVNGVFKHPSTLQLAENFKNYNIALYHNLNNEENNS